VINDTKTTQPNVGSIIEKQNRKHCHQGTKAQSNTENYTTNGTFGVTWRLGVLVAKELLRYKLHICNRAVV